jgi:hypothetical protein
LKFEVFEGDDEEKFEKLMVDITEWINTYAGLFDETEPKTMDFLNLLDDLEGQFSEEEEEKPKLGAA